MFHFFHTPFLVKMSEDTLASPAKPALAGKRGRAAMVRKGLTTWRLRMSLLLALADQERPRFSSSLLGGKIPSVSGGDDGSFVAESPVSWLDITQCMLNDPMAALSKSRRLWGTRSHAELLPGRFLAAALPRSREDSP